MVATAMSHSDAGTKDASRRRSVPGRVVPWSLAVAGAALAVLVGHDGDATWRVGRVLGVACLSWVGWRATRRSGAQRTAVALAAGLVAVPVGVGIGGPHLAKQGFTLLAACGVVLLLAGLLLLVTGTAERFRSQGTAGGVAVAVGTLVTLGVLVWSLGQAVAATNVPRTEVGARTPADHGLTYDDVTFPAGDGVRLSGWYVPSRNGAAVVLLHGAGSTRSGVLDHAVVLARHGYGVLLYDARGHGRSEGRAMDFGWYGDEDLAGAVGFVRTQPGVDRRRVAAMGMSMGGEQAIGAAAGVDGIAAVVAEGATNRVADDKAWLSDAYGLRGTVTVWLERLTYAIADVLTDASPPIPLREAVRAASVPVLLIAGGTVGAEASAGRYVQSAAPDRVDLWVVAGAGHTGGLDASPAEWERRVIAFLDRVLA